MRKGCGDGRRRNNHLLTCSTAPTMQDAGNPKKCGDGRRHNGLLSTFYLLRL